MTATRKHKLNVSFNPRLKTHLKSSDSATWLCKLPFIEKVLGRFSPISHLHHTRTPVFCAGSVVKPRLWAESNELTWHFETCHREPPTLSCPSAFRAHYCIFDGHVGPAWVRQQHPSLSPAGSPAPLFLQGAYKFFSIWLLTTVCPQTCKITLRNA